MPVAPGFAVATTEPPAPTSPAEVEQLAVGPECEAQAGAAVTHLPDVVVPAVVVAPFTAPDVEIGGEAVAGVVVDGFTIPEQIIDAGCIIAYARRGAVSARSRSRARRFPT